MKNMKLFGDKGTDEDTLLVYFEESEETSDDVLFDIHLVSYHKYSDEVITKMSSKMTADTLEKAQHAFDMVDAEQAALIYNSHVASVEGIHAGYDAIGF